MTTKTKDTRKKKEEFTNLAASKAALDKARTTYLCSDCGSDLIIDNSYKMTNPHAGGTVISANPVTS
ncbi:MAG: hypothetical protein ACRD8Z_13785 [Nitrososphaeraceae archaeon]